MKRLFAFIMIGLFLFACGEKKAKFTDEKALFDEARNHEVSQEYSKAYDCYRDFADNFPKSPLRYKAIFMAGYIQLEYLKNGKKAAKHFEALLKEYPSCDLADDAKIMYSAAASGKDLMTIFQDSLKTK